MLLVSQVCQVYNWISHKSNDCLKVWQSVVNVSLVYSWLHLVLSLQIKVLEQDNRLGWVLHCISLHH